MELGGWASLDMVLRYAHLAPSHLAEVAGNVCLPTSHKPVTRGTYRGPRETEVLREPTTTGITIQDSTVELPPPLKPVAARAVEGAMSGHARQDSNL
jgi:hypothetical protein